MSKLASKILFCCHDIIGKKLSGVGIRYIQLAKQLSKEGFNITVCSANIEKNFKISGINLVACQTVVKQEEQILVSDIVVSSALSLRLIKFTKKNHKILVFDLYDPILFEQQEKLKNKNFFIRWIKLFNIENRLKLLFATGDYFICASEIQKKLWQTYLEKLGRKKDLVNVVAFGLNHNSTKAEQNPFSKIAGIKKNDKIVLWGGGIYDWLDPLTPISAMAEIAKKRDDIKLVFLGTAHPNPGLPKMTMVEHAQSMSRKLGLLDRSVFFLPGWIDYEKRESYFQNAFIGICGHFDNLETKYAFRTRALDYIKADLPIVTTEGDYFAKLVKEDQLGIVTNFQNPKQMAQAILKLADSAKFYNNCRENINKVKSQFYWERVAGPLVAFCRKPKFACDIPNLFFLRLKYYFFTLTCRIIRS